MAIGTGTAVDFFGTQTSLTNTTAAVATTAFSVTGDLVVWTNTANAKTASMTLLANFTVAPAANTSINLYAQLLDVQSTNDNSTPAATYQHTYLGSFTLDTTSTAAQYTTIDISLPNGLSAQTYKFYVENGTDQSLPLGWNLYITDKAIGPTA